VNSPAILLVLVFGISGAAAAIAVLVDHWQRKR